jgi:hypothetical protein
VDAAEDAGDTESFSKAFSTCSKTVRYVAAPAARGLMLLGKREEREEEVAGLVVAKVLRSLVPAEDEDHRRSEEQIAGRLYARASPKARGVWPTVRLKSRPKWA